MDIFLFFGILINFLNGLVMLFVGFYMWRKLEYNFEARTIGGILALMSIVLFIMPLRILLWNLGLIDEWLASNIFFAQYFIGVFLVSLFAFPRLSYLVFNRPIAKKMGLIFSIILCVVYLIIHSTQKGKIIAFYTPQGLLFEIPYSEKIFFLFASVFLVLLIARRIIYHFYQWGKTKTFPYRLSNYLLMFFIIFAGLFVTQPIARGWLAIFSYILMLTGSLVLYLVASQELIKKEELIQPIEREGKIKKLPDRDEELERLRKLTTELKKEIERLQKKRK